MVFYIVFAINNIYIIFPLAYVTTKIIIGQATSCHLNDFNMTNMLQS